MCSRVLPTQPSVFPRAYAHTQLYAKGLTLAELVIALVMISLFVLLAFANLSGLLRRNTFKGQAQELVTTMQMAANAAAESDRRYEIIIDPVEQSYMLRQITTPVLSQVLEEEIIVMNDFGNNCRISYVLFDDGQYTNEDRAKFRAGNAGWQYGGKIVLLDTDQRPYSVVISRLSGVITLKEGDVEILVPKRQDEIPF